jgi:plasmid stabilization system protein ParE
MPRGDKDKYTDKQKRQAEHIEESYEKKGVSAEKAEEIAWSTVNKQDGGGKLSGSGRKKSSSSKKDSGDRDSSATKGSVGARPPSDS